MADEPVCGRHLVLKECQTVEIGGGLAQGFLAARAPDEPCCCRSGSEKEKGHDGRASKRRNEIDQLENKGENQRDRKNCVDRFETPFGAHTSPDSFQQTNNEFLVCHAPRFVL